MKKMYKLITVLAVLFSLSGNRIDAQILSDVGTGTTYNDQYTYPAPYGNYYWFSKHQYFISAAELTNAGIAGGASIQSIRFENYSMNGQGTLYAWQVNIYTTSSTDPLVSGMVTTGSVSSSGAPINLNATTGWNTHTVSPFIWNGSDGLIVETCHAHISGYTYNASTYWETSLTGSEIKSRWYYQDNVTACQNSGNTGTSTTNRPNIRFEWISPIPCTGTPGPNSVLAPTFQVCPNSAGYVSLANSYTIGGLSYQWQSSTISPVGPFTSIPGATMSAYSAPNLTVSTYFQAVITCINTAATTSATAGQVTVSPVIVDNVPYFEGFEGIGVQNKLPNCSWAASNMPSTCQTYVSSNTNGRTPRTGTSFASFYYNPGGTNYFYTNGIQLNAGVTYSAAMWFQTEYYGYVNWTDLSIMYGTTQSPTGLVTIASTNGPAISNSYKSLSNTFTVPNSGVYYIAIKTTVNTSNYAYYLSWDDLSITIPCTPDSPNTPTVSLVSNPTTMCAGTDVNLSVSGADTYTWSNGSNATSLLETPLNTEIYTVVGTNILTGCTHSVSQTVIVKPVPNVLVFANPASVCLGSSANLQALGGTTYTWSSGNMGQNINVSPTVPTDYTVASMGANGCIGSAVQSIGVLALPTVSVTSSRDVMCPTEVAVLTAVGSGNTYQWISDISPVVLMGNPVNVSPSATSIYTVTSTNNTTGCQNKTTLAQVVNNCTSITERTVLSGLNVYPNPSAGEFSIETSNSLIKTIEVIDVTGKVVYTSNSNAEVVKLNLKDVANGVYYVKIQSNNAVEVVKVIKQ